MPTKVLLKSLLKRGQFKAGIPKNTLKFNNLIIHYGVPLVLQQLLHEVGVPKVVLSGEQSLPVEDPMGGDTLLPMAGIHGPAHHRGTSCGTQIAANNGVNAVKKRLILHWIGS